MSNILKIEGFAGMSGDMFLGALCGLADAYQEIVKLPSLLHLEKEVSVEITDVNKSGIACKHVKVIDLLGNKKDQPESAFLKDSQQPNHSHSHNHSHDDSHSGDHHHAHTHEDSHSHSHQHSSSHPHRNLPDINALIDQGHLPERTRQIAKAIFLKLGEAESRVHGISLNEVHFHEVGAIDSIMDIVGTAWLLDKLDITKSYSIPVTTGHGFAWTEHGKLPVPTPATQLLLHDIPTVAGSQASEMTTPTGAAILKYLNPEFDIPALIETKTSYGPGEKDFEFPNALRLSLCKPTHSNNEVTMIQTNIDDLSGEFMGAEFQDGLYQAGAIDIYMEQVIMKKGRPGVILNVLCSPEQTQNVAEYILEQTSTIGIRYYNTKRVELDRKISDIHTSFGKVSVKEVKTPSGNSRIKIENKDLLRIARETGKNPLELNQLIINEYNHEKNR